MGIDRHVHGGTNRRTGRVILDSMSTVHARLRRAAALVLLASCAAFAVRPAIASNDVSLLDLVEIDYAWTTIEDRYDGALTTQALLDGARSGLIAYLRGRGIAEPRVAVMHAQADGRGAVPAIERQIGLAIERYRGRVDTRQLVYAAIRGEVGALHDRYSVFFTAAELTGFTRALDGASFGGIGVQLAFDPAAKRWRAETVFPGSPAERSGLQNGDEIVAVDGTPLAALSDDGVSAALRGAVGTTVHLEVTRAGVALPQPLAVVRATVIPPDVTARLLRGDVGYVALRGFPLDAAAQLRAAIGRLAAQGAHAYVLDLRGNGGGYESAAVHVASLFLPAGPVVANEGRRGPRVVESADGDALPAAPLAVLVDGDSASGAEVVAGALQDRKRATLVGTRTFGKGVAQEMFPLPDGSAIKLTTMRYYTAGGRFINGTGLEPDVTVAEPAGAVRGEPGADPQLDRALALLASGAV
jgi:carboxyl-terminal processing protease